MNRFLVEPRRIGLRDACGFVVFGSSCTLGGEKITIAAKRSFAADRTDSQKKYLITCLCEANQIQDVCGFLMIGPFSTLGSDNKRMIERKIPSNEFAGLHSDSSKSRQMKPSFEMFG